MRDAVATMGNILPDDAGGRDAVHVAVFSAVSKQSLSPCEFLTVVAHLPNGDTEVWAGRDGAIAIVDPFLAESVRPGQRFWAYLYPRTITALAHRWSHPAFEDTDTTYTNPAAQLRSREWMQDWLDQTGQCSIEAVMTALNRHDFEAGRDWLAISGEDAHGDIPTEFWDHAEVLLGRKIKGPKPTYFSCSC